MNNIVIYFRTLNNHIRHLKTILQLFQDFNIILNPDKSFIGYLFIELLRQHVDGFGLYTSMNKVAAIQNLDFPSTLKQLEMYLGMTG
jgi:hypothetical protein